MQTKCGLRCKNSHPATKKKAQERGMTTIFRSKILLGIQKIKKKWKGSEIAKKLVSQKLENTDEREKNHRK